MHKLVMFPYILEKLLHDKLSYEERKTEKLAETRGNNIETINLFKTCGLCLGLEYKLSL